MKKYLDINVYEATQARLKYIFEHFENIYVSFSGGKDSGLLLNLVLDYKRRHNIQKKSASFIRILRLSIRQRRILSPVCLKQYKRYRALLGLHSAGFPLRRQQLPDVLVHLGSRQKGCLGAPDAQTGLYH